MERAGRIICICWGLLAQALLSPASAHAQQQRQESQPQTAKPQDDRALALEIIAAWQNSSRGPTPQARVGLIQKALSLAVPANPWPFRDPARDVLLAQMWGQLGNEHRRIQGTERQAALGQAIAAYAQALQHLGQRRDPDWARVQFGLGTTYQELSSGDRGGNIERAIAAFDAASTVMTKEASASHWGSLQVSLSKAYWHRLAGSRTDNLERALAAAQAALGVFSRDKSPGDWAGAQQALGAAYWSRIRGSRADNIEQAIAVYEQALAVASREKLPVLWAGTHDNLGMAYAQRVRGDALDNIKRSAAAFEQAALVFTREAYPADWAQLELNFGTLLLDHELDRPSERTEAAITRFKNALTVYTPRTHPERAARVLLNLGIAYGRRQQGNPADNTEQAIAAYQTALRFYSRETDPLKWSIAQSNLGVALHRRQRGDRAANLAAAEVAQTAALSVHTSTAYPWMHMRSAHQAGNIAASQGDWTKARFYFGQAIEASERLFAGGLNQAEAGAVVKEGPQLFATAAFAALQRNNPAEALDILERGKARLLRVSLGLDALELPPQERLRLDRLRGDIKDVEHRLEQTAGQERGDALAVIEDLRSQVRRIADSAVTAAPAARNPADPSRVEMSSVEVAKSLLGDYAAIALPVVTEYGAALILATPGVSTLDIKSYPLPGLNTASLGSFLRGADGAASGAGWLGAYAINALPAEQQHARRPEWLKAIGSLPADLSRLFGVALGDALARSGVAADANVLWVPQGALGVLPVAIATGGSSADALIDRYTMTTAPGLAAALVGQQRAKAFLAEPALAAIVNPTGDLGFTEPEGAVAASYFDAKRRVTLGATDARLDAVVTALGQASHWHFATHGTFSWRSPRQSALLLGGGDRLTIGHLLDRTGLGQPRLVVLSACETGVFDFQRTPDEFVGLPVAFLQAGAAGVIGTLWPIDDVSTALLMMKVYALHFGGRAAPRDALRKAQIWIRDASHQDLLTFVADMQRGGRLSAAQTAALRASLAQGSSGDAKRPFQHPYYWAAFQYYGG